VRVAPRWWPSAWVERCTLAMDVVYIGYCCVIVRAGLSVLITGRGGVEWYCGGSDGGGAASVCDSCYDGNTYW